MWLMIPPPPPNGQMQWEYVGKTFVQAIKSTLGITDYQVILKILFKSDFISNYI